MILDRQSYLIVISLIFMFSIDNFITVDFSQHFPCLLIIFCSISILLSFMYIHYLNITCPPGHHQIMDLRQLVHLGTPIYPHPDLIC